MQTFTIGELRLAVLDDGTLPFPAHAFFANAPEASWARHVQADAAGRIPVGHNYALVQTAQELIVIDTGYGDDTHGGRTGHLLEELERAGCRREQVTRVVNTHAHGDHIKRNTIRGNGGRRPAFPRARYYLGRGDWDWFRGSRGEMHEFDAHIGTLHALGRLTLTEGALALAPGVSLLPTPGHTPGHASVLIESQGQTAIFLGDLCHHPLHFAHPDWVSRFDTHPEATPQSRAQIFRLAVEREALLICPHAPAPGAGRLQRTSEGFLWQPAA